MNPYNSCLENSPKCRPNFVSDQSSSKSQEFRPISSTDVCITFAQYCTRKTKIYSILKSIEFSKFITRKETWRSAGYFLRSIGDNLNCVKRRDKKFKSSETWFILIVSDFTVSSLKDNKTFSHVSRGSVMKILSHYKNASIVNYEIYKILHVTSLVD